MKRTLSRALALVFVLAMTLPAAGTAKGTVSYKSKAKDFNVPMKFAFLVKGPDAMDPKTTIRRLIFTTTDITAELQKCTTMSCADGSSTDTLSVDIGGPRLNYWLNLNGGLVQHSNTTQPAALKATTDTAERLAGHLAFDGTAGGGAKVDLEFDATLLKEFTKAR